MALYFRRCSSFYVLIFLPLWWLIVCPLTMLIHRQRKRGWGLFNHLSVFFQRVLCDHGEMGHHHQTGHQLAEQSPEHLHTHAVWGHDRSLHEGKPMSCVLCVSKVVWTLLIQLKAVNVSLQKHEDESEGWLHRQVRIWTQIYVRFRKNTNFILWNQHVACFCLQNEKPLFSKDGLKLFFTRAIPQGGRGKFFHISMSISQVTQYNFKTVYCLNMNMSS